MTRTRIEKPQVLKSIVPQRCSGGTRNSDSKRFTNFFTEEGSDSEQGGVVTHLSRCRLPTQERSGRGCWWSEARGRARSTDFAQHRKDREHRLEENRKEGEQQR